MNNHIAIYQSGEIEIEVSVSHETVWLNRVQLSELFGRDIKTIGKHIVNVFKEKELQKDTTVAKFATVQNERFGQKMVRFFSDGCSEFWDNAEVVCVGCCASQHHEFGYNLCNDF